LALNYIREQAGKHFDPQVVEIFLEIVHNQKMNEIELPRTARDAFFNAVWRLVRQIPSGQVATYGQIAAFIPQPSGVSPEDFKAFRARWVGHAMAACPRDVPWQRVINSQGKVSARQGADLQRRLLEAEGVLFDAHQRVNLRRFAWAGPSTDWLRTNDLLLPDQ
jgi:methylated-DNA-protein-cysteine methyltransferase-like protein